MTLNKCLDSQVAVFFRHGWCLGAKDAGEEKQKQQLAIQMVGHYPKRVMRLQVPKPHVQPVFVALSGPELLHVANRKSLTRFSWGLGRGRGGGGSPYPHDFWDDTPGPLGAEPTLVMVATYPIMEPGESFSMAPVPP